MRRTASGLRNGIADVDATRRRILHSSLSVLVGAGLLGSGSAAVLMRYLRAGDPGADFDLAEIPAESLGLWQPKRVIVRGRPGYVLRTPERVLAVSGVCTHLGCVVRWQRARREFFCPCHGARFGPDGRVRGGPVSQPLPQLKVTSSDGLIRVRPAGA